MSLSIEWTKLARYLSHECCETEVDDIETWLRSDPDLRQLILSMKKVWEMEETFPQTSDVKKLWSRIARQTGCKIERGENETHTQN